MPNFQNTIIYKLECNKTGLIYIGSTCRDFRERLNKHKKRLDCSSKKIILNNDYKADILFKYPCDSNLEKITKEQEFIDIYKKYYGDLVVNIFNAKSTKDILQEQKRVGRAKHYQNNSADINEKRKVKILCDVCNRDIRKADISTHKKTDEHQRNLGNDINPYKHYCKYCNRYTSLANYKDHERSLTCIKNFILY